MTRRVMIVPILLLALLVGGCGKSSSNTSAAGGGGAATPQASQPASTSSTGTDASTACPTSNTRAFAKTRFVSDLGGSLFLMNRYVLAPYRSGKFTKGAPGRTVAFIKAGLAVATTAKLLSNAKENAQANPTLCNAVSAPLGQLSSALSGLVDGLKSGALPGAIPDLSGLVGSLKSKAAAAGVPITEQQVPLG